MGSDHNLAPYITDIKRALASDIAEELLFEDFNTLVNTFHVPVEEAKCRLIKKYGVRQLSDLRAGEREVSVIVHVSSVKTREVPINGRQTTVSYGLLADGSGKMSFIAHVERELNVGDVVAISHGCIRELEGKLTFDITEPSTIVRVGRDEPLPIKQLTELRNGDRNINLLVQILTSELKKVGSRYITAGALADESGKLPFTSWGPNLDAGTVVRIEGAYVKSWRGIPTVNIGDMSSVFELDVEAQPRLETPKRVTIEELKMREGTYDVIVTGDIVSVRPGSGLIYRCPECERVVQKGFCRVHNKVRSRYDLRIKAVVDDGTGDTVAVLGKALTERIYGKTMDTVIDAIREGTSLDGVERDIRQVLTGRTLTLRGNATKGDYDVFFVARDAEIELGGVADRAQKIKDRLEELLT
jgi:replication factor A1